MGGEALLRSESYDAAREVVLLVMINLVAVWHFKAVGHEICSTVNLSLTSHWLIVDTVQLVNTVVLIWIEALHLHTWEMLVLEGLELIPVEHCLGLVLRYIHQRSEVVASIRRVETVEVAELHHMAY